MIKSIMATEGYFADKDETKIMHIMYGVVNVFEIMHPDGSAEILTFPLNDENWDLLESLANALLKTHKELESGFAHTMQREWGYDQRHDNCKQTMDRATFTQCVTAVDCPLTRRLLELSEMIAT